MNKQKELFFEILKDACTKEDASLDEMLDELKDRLQEMVTVSNK
ncbi:MAG: hypothetical protein ACI4XL_09810 [Bacillus sp. (in: firmicutes)]